MKTALILTEVIGFLLFGVIFILECGKSRKEVFISLIGAVFWLPVLLYTLYLIYVVNNDNH